MFHLDKIDELPIKKGFNRKANQKGKPRIRRPKAMGSFPMAPALAPPIGGSVVVPPPVSTTPVPPPAAPGVPGQVAAAPEPGKSDSTELLHAADEKPDESDKTFDGLYNMLIWRVKDFEAAAPTDPVVWKVKSSINNLENLLENFFSGDGQELEWKDRIGLAMDAFVRKITDRAKVLSGETAERLTVLGQAAVAIKQFIHEYDPNAPEATFDTEEGDEAPEGDDFADLDEANFEGPSDGSDHVPSPVSPADVQAEGIVATAEVGDAAAPVHSPAPQEPDRHGRDGAGGRVGDFH